MIRVSVMYPNDGGRFDMDYYINKHMALVHKLLEPYGLGRPVSSGRIPAPASSSQLPRCSETHWTKQLR